MKKAEISHSVLPAARPRARTRTAAIFTVALGFALNAIGARAEGNAVRFGPNLGHAQGHPRRPHGQCLAHQAVHRPRSAL